MRTMRTLRYALLVVALIFGLLLTGCSGTQTPTPITKAAAPSNPDYTIDMTADHHLNGLSLNEGQTVLLKNVQPSTNPITIAGSGNGYNVYVEGDLPAGANLAVYGAGVHLVVSGNIVQGAAVTMQGDMSEMTVEGNIDDLTIINIGGKNAKILTGFPKSDQTKKYADTIVP